MKEYLELGQIVNTKGLKGEVKLNSFAEDNAIFERLPKVFLKSKAETLRNAYLLVKRTDLDDLPEGVYYIADLIGLEVYTDKGEFLGKVDDIYSTGANDIYVVKNEMGKQKLLPGTDEVIKETNLAEGKIIVHLIEGL